MIFGIDVSRYQSIIDWEKARNDGVMFAFVKASEGETYRDLYFSRNVDGCNEHGIAVGAYHYFKANVDPIKQAEHFYSVCKGHTFQLPPVMDFEVLPTGAEMASRFIGATAAYWDDSPLIYSCPAFLKSLPRDQWLEDLAKYRLWIAHYNGRPGEPMATPPWTEWLFHQYSDKGKRLGIAGPCDLNVFAGTEEELLSLRRRTMPSVPVTEHIDGVLT